MRVETDKPLANGGWLHRLHDSPNWRPGRRVRRVPMTAPKTAATVDFAALADRCAAAVGPDALAAFAAGLGVAVESLQRLGVGWIAADELHALNTSCRSAGCWTFAMRGADGAIIGIRLRTMDGFKYAVAGSRQGLFIPSGLSTDGPLIVTEGPSDTAAMLSLNFAAIGRPSATGGVDLVCRFTTGRRTFVLLADADEAGRIGVHALAYALALQCRSVRVVVPPVGMKDGRQWLQRGATRDDVLGAIRRAEPVRVGVTGAAL